MISTFLFTLPLAEVSDKEPSVVVIWLISLYLSGLVFLLSRWRKWASLIALPFIGFWAFALVVELRDPNVGTAILQELGRGYVVQAYVAAVVPIMCTLLAPFKFRRCSSY